MIDNYTDDFINTTSIVSPSYHGKLKQMDTKIHIICDIQEGELLSPVMYLTESEKNEYLYIPREYLNPIGRKCFDTLLAGIHFYLDGDMFLINFDDNQLDYYYCFKKQ